MKRLNQIAVAVGAATLAFAAANTALLLGIRAKMAAGGVIQDRAGIALGVLILTLALLHIAGAIDLIAMFRKQHVESFVRSAAFAAAFFSLFLLAVDVVMLGDIGKEYVYGFDVSGEWNIVLVSQGVHLFFGALLLIAGVAIGRKMKRDAEAEAVRDEALFLSVHEVGIVSAVFGALLVGMFGVVFAPHALLNGLMFLLCIVALVPYGCIVVLWFVTKRKVRPSDWYDEKQWRDLLQGSMVTLVTMVFATIVCYLLSALGVLQSGTIFYFPAYLLGTLLLFSGMTLYRNKRV